VRKRPSAGVSITPMELGWTRRTESLPMHWLGGSDGQNKEGRFPMVGIGRDEKGDNRLLGQADMIIVSFRCLGTKATEQSKRQWMSWESMSGKTQTYEGP
jgi:hypothetical protein